MTIRKKLLSLAMLFMVVSLSAAPLTLVRNGKANASIVIAADKPSRAAQFAAFEIQHHIKLITGATLPIINDINSAAVKGVKILVGDSAATRALNIKREAFKNEEYMVKTTPDAIVLIGNDTIDGRKVDYQNKTTFPFSYYYRPISNSTLWAAYDFLEKGCDVRHYAPTDLGITYKPRKTLTVDMKNYRRKPAMDAYRFFYAPNMYYERGKPFSERDVSLLRLRWRGTERFGICNHNVSSLWYKYYKKAKTSPYKEEFIKSHPEYFAQGYKNKSHLFLISNTVRSQYPGDGSLPAQPCLTNKKVIEHYAKEAVAASRGKFAAGAMKPRSLPNMAYYYPIELDDNRAVCKCRNCRKMFADKSEKQRPGYLKYNWINEIAKATAKIDPNVGIITLVYGDAFFFPEEMKLSPNVTIQMCLSVATWWHPAGYKEQHDQAYKQWVANCKKPFMVWTYFGEPGWSATKIYKYDHFFPGFYASKVAEIFKEFAKDGVRGWFGETHDEIDLPLWYDQLELYMATRLTDDPTLDSDELKNEFFNRYYGAAAEPMRKFYDIIENTYWNTKTYPKKTMEQTAEQTKSGMFTEEISWGVLGTKERMAELGKLIATAKKLAKTDQEKKRIEWFDKGLWQSMLIGKKNYAAKEKFRARPVPEIVVPKIIAVNGNVKKVDWNKAITVQWKTVSGFPVTSKRKLQLAHDGKFLYIKYFEPGNATKLKVEANPWMGDDIEFFFASATERPYHQLALNPAGKSIGNGYYNANMVNYNGKWQFGEKISSQADRKAWTVMVAFPLDKILSNKKLKPGDEFRANIFRNMPGKLAQGWSPIFGRSFHTLERLGKIKLAK